MTLSTGTLLGILALFWCNPDEKAVQSQIKKFQEDFHKPGARDDERILAVAELAQTHHERVVKILAPLLVEGSLPLRMIVARNFALFAGVESAPRELLSALQSAANAGKGMAAVRIEILRALGALAYKPAAPEVARLILDREVWVAKAAIDASGKIRFEEALPPLIKALERLEGRAGDGEISVNPLDGILEGVSVNSLFKPDPRHPRPPKERELLKAPIEAALESITKQSFVSAKDWDKWWNKNRTSFRIGQ